MTTRTATTTLAEPVAAGLRAQTCVCGHGAGWHAFAWLAWDIGEQTDAPCEHAGCACPGFDLGDAAGGLVPHTVCRHPLGADYDPARRPGGGHRESHLRVCRACGARTVIGTGLWHPPQSA